MMQDMPRNDRYGGVNFAFKFYYVAVVARK